MSYAPLHHVRYGSVYGRTPSDPLYRGLGQAMTVLAQSSSFLLSAIGWFGAGWFSHVVWKQSQSSPRRNPRRRRRHRRR
jgi:hypothetical protein